MENFREVAIKESMAIGLTRDEAEREVDEYITSPHYIREEEEEQEE